MLLGVIHVPRDWVVRSRGPKSLQGAFPMQLSAHLMPLENVVLQNPKMYISAAVGVDSSGIGSKSKQIQSQSQCSPSAVPGVRTLLQCFCLGCHPLIHEGFDTYLA